jgi:hypothetical protein
MGGVDFGQVLVSEADAGGGGVFFQMRGRRRFWDADGVAIAQAPGQRDLRGRGVVPPAGRRERRGAQQAPSLA